MTLKEEAKTVAYIASKPNLTKDDVVTWLWVPLSVAEVHEKDSVTKEHDKVVAYWEKVYDELKKKLSSAEKELELVRQEAIRAIEKAKTERYESLEMQADLNGYSRGRADAEEELKKCEEKLETIRKLKDEAPLWVIGRPAIFDPNEKPETEFEKGYAHAISKHTAEFCLWLSKLEKILGEVSQLEKEK